MADSLDYSKLGQRIRKYRIAAHLTQEQLSELVGVTPASISRLETNTNNCSLQLLIKIANTLSVGATELLCDSLTAPEIVSPYIDKDIAKLLENTSLSERKIVAEIIEATLKALRENHK